MANLHKSGLVPLIMELLESGKPFLGICLGMQVLFEGSDEAPGVPGLGYFKGQVKYLKTSHKIPHMGWNKLYVKNESPCLAKQRANLFTSYIASIVNRKIKVSSLPFVITEWK